MRKFFLAVALAAMAFCTPALAADNAADLMQAQDQMFIPTVQVRVDSNIMGQFMGYCSGSVIASERDQKSGNVTTLVLTAKHCTDATDQRMQIVSYVHDKMNRETKQEVYKAKVCGRSYKSDLALIKLDDQQTFFDKVATVAAKDSVLSFGDDVDLVGYPAGLGLTWTQGKLGYVEDVKGLAFEDVSQSGEFYRATPMMTGGSSGSPMFANLDGKYQVIGVLTGGGLGYLGFYTPVDEIQTYLKDALVGCGIPDKTADKTTEPARH